MIKNTKLKVTRILRSEVIDTYIDFLKYDNSFVGWLIHLDNEMFQEVVDYCYKREYLMEDLCASLSFAVLFGKYPKVGDVFMSFDWNYTYNKVRLGVTEAINYRSGKFVRIENDCKGFEFKPNLSNNNEYEDKLRYFDEKHFDVHNKLRK